MKEQSRLATAEGMKAVAEALASKGPKEDSDSSIELLDSEDEDSYTSSSSSGSGGGSRRHRRHHHRRRKHRKSDGGGSAAVDKMEQRVHYLKLDLSNAKVETEELRTEVNRLKAKTLAFDNLDKQFAALKKIMNDAVEDTSDLNRKQVQNKYYRFLEESGKQVEVCATALVSIEPNNIRLALTRVNEAEKRKLIAIERSFHFILTMKRLKEFALYAMMGLCVILIMWIMFR
jgi:predicted RNase H-like nuclease (RuvC/YqgF family)